MEKAEQAEGDRLKKNDAYERAEWAKALAQFRATGDKLRTDIAAMSPQERASPAFLVGDTLGRRRRALRLRRRAQESGVLSCPPLATRTASGPRPHAELAQRALATAGAAVQAARLGGDQEDGQPVRTLRAAGLRCIPREHSRRTCGKHGASASSPALGWAAKGLSMPAFFCTYCFVLWIASASSTQTADSTTSNWYAPMMGPGGWF
jgi:hypothetical protein